MIITYVFIHNNKTLLMEKQKEIKIIHIIEFHQHNDNSIFKTWIMLAVHMQMYFDFFLWELVRFEI